MSESLKNNELLKEDSTLSFYDFNQEIYVYGFTLIPETKITKNLKFTLIRDNTVIIMLFIVVYKN